MREPQRRAREHERRIAGKFGATLNAASGSLDLRKNDARNADESIECKTTSAYSFRLELHDLLKAGAQADLDGRRMVFCVELLNTSQRPGAGYRYVVLSEHDYLELTGRGT